MSTAVVNPHCCHTIPPVSQEDATLRVPHPSPTGAQACPLLQDMRLYPDTLLVCGTTGRSRALVCAAQPPTHARSRQSL